jgi:hypothetical protein
MTAVVVPFPRHPVRVLRVEHGWLVVWRGCGWLFATRAMAMWDAAQIAAAHGERIIADPEIEALTWCSP